MEAKKSAGLAVDSFGGPTVDPTQNVKDLFEGANRRQDDLRDAERRYNDLRDQYQREIAILRSEHTKELSAKESSRLDSIRQVDREDVAKTAASANLAIQTLAKQTADLATTLQTQVQATAAAAETRRTADMSEVNKRVSALELASSASAGKNMVADPALERLAVEVQKLVSAQSEGTGKAAIADPQLAIALTTLSTEVKSLREKENTRTGFDAGKAAAIAAALAAATVVGGGGVAIAMKILGGQ